MTQNTEGIDFTQIRRMFDEIQRESLEPLAPEEGLELYLRQREAECASNTLETHKSRITKFITWCQEQGIENLNDLTGRDFNLYRIWCREVHHLNKVSEKHSQDTLRVFIRFLESINAVPNGLSKYVLSPTLSAGEGVRDSVLTNKRMGVVLAYLKKYRYASLDHVVWQLLRDTGLRIGSLRALDISDYCPDGDIPHIRLRHVSSETPLKGKIRSERWVAIEPELSEIIDAFLEVNHPQVEDPHGRKPLLGTIHGRVADSTLRRIVYRWSRPCAINEECPHNQSPDECNAAVNPHQASQCPSSRSPHTARRGYITHLLECEVPMDVIEYRCGVSATVIRKHYDVRDHERKLSRQESSLQNLVRDKDPEAV